VIRSTIAQAALALALGAVSPLAAMAQPAPHQWANNAESTLASGINASVTSIPLATGGGALFPTPGQGYYVTIEEGPITAPTGREIVLVTARSSDTLTVTRARQSTTGTAFSAGARVVLRITAGALDRFVDTGDSRLSDARTPSTHASSHLPGGSDALTVAAPSSVGTSNSAGSAASFSRSDHVHAIAADAVGASQIAAAAVGASEIDTAAVPRVAGLGIGLAGVSGALAAASISLPSAPSAGNLTVFAHTIAGQDLLAMRSATRTTVLGFCPTGSVRFGLIPQMNAASVAGAIIPAGISYGATQYTVSGTGTGSFPSPTGSTFQLRAPHLHIVAGTAANSYADAFNGSSNTVGVGLVNRVDGFRWMTIVSDETNITTNQNDFVGFGAATGAVNDSGTREGVLFGYRPSSASTDNWQFMTRNTTTLTSVDLGSNCQRSTTSVYMFAMIAEPGASEIGYEAWNVTDPSAPVLCARGTQTNTLPTASTLLVKENYSQHTSGTTPSQHNIYVEEGCIGLGLQ